MSDQPTFEGRTESPFTQQDTQTENRRMPAVALPATVADLMAQKKTKNARTLNDEVESVHLALYGDDTEIGETYLRLLDAVYPEQCVEGSVVADDIEAARMVRDYAKENGSPIVAAQKLETLRKSLNVVLRRYGISRKERRER